jgi:tetratricopeptide (TPR) repeat protein
MWGPPAIEQFERTVERDPDFAEGWAELARARTLLGYVGGELRYRSQFPKAREEARRALELDDRLGRAHSALGEVRLYYDWDLAEARDALERGVQLSPGDPAALNSYARYLAIVGRLEEALELSERLLRVAPLDLAYRTSRIAYLQYARQYERALEELDRVRELAPDHVDNTVESLYIVLGRFEEAHRTSIAMWELCGTPCDPIREAIERGWVEGGWEGSVRAFLAVATNIEGFSPAFIALYSGQIGETDQAFDWLERGYRERDPVMITLKTLPAWDPLRSDPRFDDLLRRIGFPESPDAL